MRIASSPHSSRALAVLPPKFPLRFWLVLSLLLSFVSGHQRIETFSHVTTVLLSRLPYGVHFWMAGRAFSGKWLTARVFFASKNCTALRLKARISFLYPPVMCYSDFWPRSNGLFWAKKAKHFEFTKNNMATLNNERLAKIWNPGNAKLQTCNCKLKNLMLKVSNITASPPRFSRLKINRRLRDDWGRVSLSSAISKSYDEKSY